MRLPNELVSRPVREYLLVIQVLSGSLVATISPSGSKKLVVTCGLWPAAGAGVCVLLIWSALLNQKVVAPFCALALRSVKDQDY